MRKKALKKTLQEIISVASLGEKHIFSGQYATFKDCVVDAIRERVDLSGALFHGRQLKGVCWADTDLKHAYFQNCCLDKGIFSGMFLDYTHFSDCTFKDADLIDASFSGSTFDLCEFDMARVRGALLEEGNSVFAIDKIGSRSSTLRCFNTVGGVEFHTGCFSGDEDDFRKAIKKTHKSNKYAREYRAAIQLTNAYFEKEPTT